MSTKLTAPTTFTTDAPLLEVRDVAHSFGSRRILDGVSLTVHRGEVVAIIGPNGAGKSTFLAALSGDMTPDAGSVLISGVPVAQWKTMELARERAVLLQESRVAFSYSVDEVVRMGRTPWRRRPESVDDDAIVARSLGETDVAHLASRDVTTLSGGENGRTQLARVIAQQTGLMLLDEPTAALDIRHQESTLALCRARAAEGAGVVVVLHDIDVAAAYCDRIVVLSQGTVFADGPAEQVCTSELLSEVYEWPIDVISHPRTGRLIVLPQREAWSQRPVAHGRE